MVWGLPFLDHLDQLCEEWLLGKHTRKRFPKEATIRAKKPLEAFIWVCTTQFI